MRRERDRIWYLRVWQGTVLLGYVERYGSLGVGITDNINEACSWATEWECQNIIKNWTGKIERKKSPERLVPPARKKLVPPASPVQPISIEPVGLYNCLNST